MKVPSSVFTDAVAKKVEQNVFTRLMRMYPKSPKRNGKVAQQIVAFWVIEFWSDDVLKKMYKELTEK